MAEAERVEVAVDGRRLSVSNLDKVLYPLVGFTKAQVIDYYVRVAPTLLPHIEDRGITLRRWPDGVTSDSFFEKRCPSHRPGWVGTCVGPGDRRGGIDYCRLDSVAALAWTANLAALEIHSPMARCTDIDSPSMVVFDLDPGKPATIIECCRVALRIRAVLESVGLESCAKTSGNKGLQLYVPLNSPHTHDDASDFALAVAQLLEQDSPELVLSNMNRKRRADKIFVDWSQNSRHKTTIAPYSLRGRDRPTVSTPLSWDEVSDGADSEPVVFEAGEVLERIAEFGDLFAATLTLQQQLPTTGA
ncbi:MAG: non-homologous end-joining DNA ligase [Acidimicrobiaceae bacterium]|nr:non-homologous end-joining DNA ligase [Acidimicrobiaceae bacterium]